MYSKNDAKVVLFVLIYKQKTGLFDVCLKYIAYLCAFLKNLSSTYKCNFLGADNKQ